MEPILIRIDYYYYFSFTFPVQIYLKAHIYNRNMTIGFDLLTGWPTTVTELDSI